MARTGLYDLSRIFERYQRQLYLRPSTRKYSPAPTKLYLPIVSVVSALSKRNEYSDFALLLSQRGVPVLQHARGGTNFAEILRYASDGVRRSAGSEAYSGTRFGALGEPLERLRISWTVSREGWILIWSQV